MEPVLLSAYRAVAVRHRCGVDRILVSPRIRGEFLDCCRQSLGDDPGEESLLGLLVNLRKRCKLPRSRELFDDSPN